MFSSAYSRLGGRLIPSDPHTKVFTKYCLKVDKNLLEVSNQIMFLLPSIFPWTLAYVHSIPLGIFNSDVTVLLVNDSASYRLIDENGP